MAKKKVCVIFTGGTIGSFTDGKSVDLIGGGKCKLIELYREKFGSNISFDELRPVNILSENITLYDINKIAECVKSIDCTKYDGIIFTHGTDTLSFTANLFSQIFRDIPVPLVFVSALYPLDDKRSYGLENFKAALDFIDFATFGGVFVSFKFENEPQYIHLASRILWSDQINGRFSSILNKPFAKVVEGKVELLSSPTIEQLEDIRKPFGDFKLSDEVITIEARSLLNFKMYDFERVRPKAVIIKLYHSGTICTVGENSVYNFVDYCKGFGIEVILTPVDSKANVYASAKELTKKCHISYDQSYEMTLVKVMLALGMGRKIEDLLKEDSFFEHV